MNQNRETERILREHRHWTRWIKAVHLRKEGNLVLTNRRLLFLHKIQSSSDVKENIKKLADAPMESVLNYAFTLNVDNFQIPLSSITGMGIGVFSWYPSVQICLNISYVSGRQQNRRTVSFQFIRPIMQTILHPQIAVDIGWIRAIKKAIKDTKA